MMGMLLWLTLSSVLKVPEACDNPSPRGLLAKIEGLKEIIYGLYAQLLWCRFYDFNSYTGGLHFHDE